VTGRRRNPLLPLLAGAALVVLAASPLPGQEDRAGERPLIVIDAGHGGRDPGARGAGGTLEKEVTLAVALELQATLRATGAYEVRLTRAGDVLVPLGERARQANAWRAEGGPGRPALFVSIHTNAHERSSVRGVETYFLSEALTEDARRVAAMENAATRFEDPRDAADPLDFILNDLRQNLYLRESSDGAGLIHRRLAAAHPGPDRGVKQAGFIVLNGAFMPAVLVELGFITNPQEEALLGSHEHQRRLARELAEGIRDFFTRPSARPRAGAR
jgi:N-acetylmuramoyl-L-alanine amidase